MCAWYVFVCVFTTLYEHIIISLLNVNLCHTSSGFRFLRFFSFAYFRGERWAVASHDPFLHLCSLEHVTEITSVSLTV